MNYNNSTDVYMRSIAKIGTRQPVRSLELFDLSGWLVLWKPVGKILLLLFPLLLMVNLLISSAVSNADSSIAGLDNERHKLMDKNIELLASRARLWAPENIRKLAGEKLALYENSGDQIGHFSRKKGMFIYKSSL